MARGPLAGVAGPGKFAVRTDGLSLPSAGYGEGVETQAIKQGAPLAKTPDVLGAQGSQVKEAAMKAAPVTSLYAPTERPQEPITHGIALGAGAGPEVLGMANQDSAQYTSAYQLFQQLASNPNASPTLKYLAQRVQQGF